MSSDDNMFSEEDIKDLIKDALKNNYEGKKKYNKKIQLENALASTLKEFLTNFVVIGYDLNGKPIILKHAKTPMEKDALSSLAIKYISYLMYENGQ
jgi:hypothetical protein